MCCNPDLIQRCLEAEDKEHPVMPSSAIIEHMASFQNSTDPPPTADAIESARARFERLALATSSKSDNELTFQDKGTQNTPEEEKEMLRAQMEARLEGKSNKPDKTGDTKKLDLRKYTFQPDESDDEDEDEDEDLPAELQTMRDAVSRLNALAEACNPGRQNENLVCTFGCSMTPVDTTMSRARLDRMYGEPHMRIPPGPSKIDL